MFIWRRAQHQSSGSRERSSVMANPVVHFEILGPDGPKLRDFYQSVFEWQPQVMPGPMDYGSVAAGGSGGIGGGIGGGDAARVTFYVQVDDIDGYLRQIESSGGKTIVPRTVIPNVVTFANFADPQGNVVGLVESMA
jgi:predicted enzyme related to lactoylglutathione lyase